MGNGALLTAAENEGFEVLVTTDQNIPFQQNVTGRQIAILILAASSNRTPELLPLIPQAISELSIIAAGQIVIVKLPDPN